ncbi:uncharacterized protein BDR25DRAFT_253591 [Lindgomyces ingoldianus]|uniref:Uncharacterized protein n=1 Tax=Lindgomyces ingoldianus TaxID=673940 RepID=A0ACB6R9F7_9PLEO|nr:uncharacterized protein BDR25DRAFT_253591 [Lindgomyces ingoldianus]KAF2475953.1 hypothetical protein BDR25DRAFT_253591 [Lindgomyces ingoldianus]
MALGDIQDGYPGLAKFMGPHFDSGMGLFKRFADLNARNLLYMQAELVNLELELNVLTHDDHTSRDPTRETYEKSVWNMAHSPDSAQWKKVLEIRQKVKDYNDALLQQSQLCKLNKANDYDVGILLHWLLHAEGGNGFLEGFEARPWKKGERRDLISICSRARTDKFTRWAERKAYPWLYAKVLKRWKKPINGQEKVGIAHLNDNWFVRLARVMTVILSTLLPSIAVLGLYYVRSLPAHLGAVVGFSAMFSLALEVFTNSRPIEVFTATAAFAAVQVVFVGSTGQNSCECFVSQT